MYYCGLDLHAKSSAFCISDRTFGGGGAAPVGCSGLGYRSLVAASNRTSFRRPQHESHPSNSSGYVNRMGS
jgi:hypothetical protein